ncbi:hypothetical protein D3C71_1988650 [compost metagenome]
MNWTMLSLFRMSVTSRFRRLLMSAGIPLGAIRPSQPTASKSLSSRRPLSRTVGTSGSCDERVAEVTASGTARLAWICGSAAVTESTISGT